MPQEYPVLLTIPWEKLDIWVVGIEFHHLEKVFDGNKEDVMR